MGKKPREIKFAVHMPDNDKEKDAFYENLARVSEYATRDMLLVAIS